MLFNPESTAMPAGSAVHLSSLCRSEFELSTLPATYLEDNISCNSGLFLPNSGLFAFPIIHDPHAHSFLYHVTPFPFIGVDARFEIPQYTDTKLCEGVFSVELLMIDKLIEWSGEYFPLC